MFYNLPLLLIVATLSILLSGCWMIPVPHGNVPIKVDDVESMLGSSKDEIEKRFGCPNWELRDSKNTYYIYQSRSHASHIVMMLYIPIWWESAEADAEGACDRCEWADEEDIKEPPLALYCVMLELDREDVLRRYEVETDLPWTNVPQPGVDQDCRDLFWTNKELNMMDHTIFCGKQK